MEEIREIEAKTKAELDANLNKDLANRGTQGLSS